MTRERWRLVQDVFLEAVELPAHERAAFLDEAAADDDDLRRQVMDLLDADADPPPVLGASVDDLAALMMEGDILPSSSTKVGAYRIVRELGRGGMGTVYLAERADEQFEQRVAVKLIQRGLDDEHVRRRFLSERSILASLQHPSIARLYDGGHTDDGRPFLVMEYVDGRPIDAYCDTMRLSINDRLKLFQSVCDAVQYAHQNLIVHRDLKPNNILVDRDGRVRLLDFGIAKLLHDDVPEVAVTRTGMRVMTPEYAAPEQMVGGQVTTATDVYALGVVLYELLTGRRPYDVSNKSMADAERTVVSEMPQRPSTAVGRPSTRRQDGGEVTTVPPEVLSAARRTTVDRLRRRLRGDLDRILLKSLRKEPERRYASAEAFLEDIKRHLEGLPVRARPETPGYRFRKFVARNRVAVAAAALVACSLVTGLGVALWQAEEARRERDTAQEISAFLENLFDAADPFAASTERLDTLRIRDFLDRGAHKIRRELVDQPEVQARLLTTLGRVHQQLGLYDEARTLLEEAVDRRRSLYGDDHLETLASMSSLAGVFENEGKYDEATRLYREILQTYREQHGNNHAEVADVMNGLALALNAEGKFDEAEQLHREALGINRRILPEDDPALAANINMLASLLIARGTYDEAEDLYRESLDLRRRRHGDDHPSIAIGLNNLAVLLRDVRRFDEAEPLIREALDINRRIFGDEHPHVADNLNTLGSVLRNKGDYEAAEPVLIESIELGRKLYGDRHPSVSVKLDTYASLKAALGDYEAAERLELEAISIAREAFGDDHFAVAITTGRLAGILRRKGELDRAERLYREAHSRMRGHFPDDHPNVVLINVNLAGCLVDQGRHAAAEPILVESYEMLRAGQGLEHRHTQNVLADLISLYDATERPELAAEYRKLTTSAAGASDAAPRDSTGG